MGTSSGTRRALAQTKALAALTLTVAFCLFVPSSAFAAASYVFEPTLSLTGNCATSNLDLVPDRGTCPIPPGTVFSGSPGADHPSKGFRGPGVTVDNYADVYVENIVEKEGRIDVFSPEGFFITEVEDEAGPQSIAVDSEGNLYTFERLAGGERQVSRFSPTVYKPEAEEIEYGASVKLVGGATPPLPLGSGKLDVTSAVAIDPTNDQLFVDYGKGVARFGSAKEGNVLLDSETIKVEGESEGLEVPRNLSRSTSIAIDAKHGRIYVSDKFPKTIKSLIRVFELKAPYKELGQITGSTTPKGEFISPEGFLAVDVNEAFGHVFVGDFSDEKVYEFEETGGYVATIEHSFEGVPLTEIAVDNDPKSPHPQKEGWLFVPSVPSPGAGHVYAFEPNEEGPPIVKSVAIGGITETEAVMHAIINPGGVATEYRLEYVSQEQFEAEAGKSFEEGNATIRGEGTLPKGAEDIPVSAPATGLEPGTAYRLRAFAKNSKDEDEKQRTFKTFETVEGPPPCGNEALRTGLSALLPDCRAYELVTPPNTNGRPPTGGITGIYFPAVDASPDGNRASFLIEGGNVPGNEGSGSFSGDRYLATRSPEGWTSAVAGPNGEEAFAPTPGSASPDQTYSVWKGQQIVQVHYPDGHSELVGKGSLGEDPHVTPYLITEGGGHIVFGTGGGTAIPLELDAPPAKTGAVYDRSAEGPTHVVSLLPGDETPKAGENAQYLGASEDGEGIAFKVGSTIYVRLHNTETLEVAGSETEFAGISEEGKRVFYLEGSDLFAYDTEAEKAIPFSESGDVIPVNVATGGTRAYLVSPSILTTEPNPEGEEAEAGQENLYLAQGEGQFRFVGIVTKRDVEGEKGPVGLAGGLGLWIEGIKQRGPAKDPSRATPSGSRLLFESRANLTGFESEGFAQVYRYDSSEDRLDCLSCSPTGTPPSSNASLQSSDSSLQSIEEIARSHLIIPNQTPDGKRAFFQTAEPLVLGDTDGKLDVYEWEEKGVGGCKKSGGCVYLISGGHSAGPDFLFAMSRSGGDVFFRTSDLLLPRDAESTLSLYDARVDGGFLEPEPPIPCEGEGCHPVVPPPTLPGNTTSAVGPDDKVPTGKHCPRGKHKDKRHNKCVKNHHKKKHRGKAGAKAKGGSQ